MFAVMISCFISASLGPSLFDAILEAKGIPVLPLAPATCVNVTAKPPRPIIASDVMLKYEDDGVVPVLKRHMTFIDIVNLLNDHDDLFFPIVNNKKNRRILGEVSRRALREKMIDLSLEGIYGQSSEEEVEEEEDSDFEELEEPPSPRTLRIQHQEKLISAASATQKNFVIQQESNEDEIQSYAQQHINRRASIRHSLKLLRTPLSPKAKPEPVKKHRRDSTGSVTKNCKLDLIFELGDKVNMTPVCVPGPMPLTKIYTLFHILRPSKIYVQKQSVLAGVIKEKVLVERERKLLNKHRELL